jgi:predicted Fe-S protein YdhL (DUF1289 family)
MSVPSPCINICRMHGPRGGLDDWCEGCARTIEEIAAWGRMDDAAKRSVWAQLPARRARWGLTPLQEASTIAVRGGVA